MKMTLQYGAGGSGPWSDFGDVILKGENKYTVSPILDRNILGKNETTAYSVKVSAKSLDLDSGFLNNTQWFFRMFHPKPTEANPPGSVINLGQRSYILDKFEGEPALSEITTYFLVLDFLIKVSEYSSYTDLLILSGQ